MIVQWTRILGAAALVLASVPAHAAGKIYYGSRAGMQVTVLSMQGLDTQRAVIRTKHTREDAVAFCRDYVNKVTKECIQRELETRMNDEIKANCTTGVFTNFWGDRLQFRGRTRGGDEFAPKYVLKNLGTGDVADGSSASGYGTNMGIFKALCPSRAPTDE